MAQGFILVYQCVENLKKINQLTENSSDFRKFDEKFEFFLDLLLPKVFI
jgi:hypothetical protein